MLKLAKDSSLRDIISTDQKPYIHKTTDEQVDVIPEGEESNYEPNPDYNPLETQHPIEGSAEDTEVYLFNDNDQKRYESVTIKPTDNTGSDESGWIELSTDGSVFTSEISLGDIGDTDGHLVHVRVTTPTVEETQNKTDIKLTVEGTEFAI